MSEDVNLNIITLLQCGDCQTIFGHLVHNIKDDSRWVEKRCINCRCIPGEVCVQKEIPNKIDKIIKIKKVRCLTCVDKNDSLDDEIGAPVGD